MRVPLTDTIDKCEHFQTALEKIIDRLPSYHLMSEDDQTSFRKLFCDIIRIVANEQIIKAKGE